MFLNFKKLSQNYNGQDDDVSLSEGQYGIGIRLRSLREMPNKLNIRLLVVMLVVIAND